MDASESIFNHLTSDKQRCEGPKLAEGGQHLPASTHQPGLEVCKETNNFRDTYNRREDFSCEQINRNEVSKDASNSKCESMDFCKYYDKQSEERSSFQGNIRPSLKVKSSEIGDIIINNEKTLTQRNPDPPQPLNSKHLGNGENDSNSKSEEPVRIAYNSLKYQVDLNTLLVKPIMRKEKNETVHPETNNKTSSEMYGKTNTSSFPSNQIISTSTMIEIPPNLITPKVFASEPYNTLTSENQQSLFNSNNTSLTIPKNSSAAQKHIKDQDKPSRNWNNPGYTVEGNLTSHPSRNWNNPGYPFKGNPTFQASRNWNNPGYPFEGNPTFYPLRNWNNPGYPVQANLTFQASRNWNNPNYPVQGNHTFQASRNWNNLVYPATSDHISDNPGYPMKGNLDLSSRNWSYPVDDNIVYFASNNWNNRGKPNFTSHASRNCYNQSYIAGGNFATASRNLNDRAERQFNFSGSRHWSNRAANNVASSASTNRSNRDESSFAAFTRQTRDNTTWKKISTPISKTSALKSLEDLKKKYQDSKASTKGNDCGKVNLKTPTSVNVEPTNLPEISAKITNIAAPNSVENNENLTKQHPEICISKIPEKSVKQVNSETDQNSRTMKNLETLKNMSITKSLTSEPKNLNTYSPNLETFSTTENFSRISKILSSKSLEISTFKKTDIQTYSKVSTPKDSDPTTDETSARNNPAIQPELKNMEIDEISDTENSEIPARQKSPVGVLVISSTRTTVKNSLVMAENPVTNFITIFKPACRSTVENPLHIRIKQSTDKSESIQSDNQPNSKQLQTPTKDGKNLSTGDKAADVKLKSTGSNKPLKSIVPLKRRLLLRKKQLKMPLNYLPGISQQSVISPCTNGGQSIDGHHLGSKKNIAPSRRGRISSNDKDRAKMMSSPRTKENVCNSIPTEISDSVPEKNSSQKITKTSVEMSSTSTSLFSSSQQLEDDESLPINFHLPSTSCQENNNKISNLVINVENVERKSPNRQKEPIPSKASRGWSPEVFSGFKNLNPDTIYKKLLNCYCGSKHETPRITNNCLHRLGLNICFVCLAIVPNTWKHIRNHNQKAGHFESCKNQKVICPFPDCMKILDYKRGIKNHLTRIHFPKIEQRNSIHKGYEIIQSQVDVSKPNPKRRYETDDSYDEESKNETGSEDWESSENDEFDEMRAPFESVVVRPVRAAASKASKLIRHQAIILNNFEKNSNNHKEEHKIMSENSKDSLTDSKKSLTPGKNGRISGGKSTNTTKYAPKPGFGAALKSFASALSSSSSVPINGNKEMINGSHWSTSQPDRVSCSRSIIVPSVSEAAYNKNVSESTVDSTMVSQLKEIFGADITDDEEVSSSGYLSATAASGSE